MLLRDRFVVAVMMWHRCWSNEMLFCLFHRENAQVLSHKH